MLSASDFPEVVDRHAVQYKELEKQVNVAKAALDKKKGELVKLATRSGATPPGAEKSMRLSGHIWDITASFGTSSSVDDAVVELIQEELVKTQTPRLFKMLFQSKVSYIVAPTAPTILENLSKRVRELFARVMTTKPKKPSLTVAKRKKGAK